MKKSTPNTTPFFSKIYCSLFGHDYLLSKHVTHHIKEYTCAHCGEQATTNSRGRLEVMTPKLKEINNALASVHAKKAKRKKAKATFQAAS